MEPACRRIETPLGTLIACASPDALVSLSFPEDAPPALSDDRSRVLDLLADELEAYFAGDLRAFRTPMAPQGTPFMRRVWDALQTIPYGQTRSYAQIAHQIGCPNGQRAVGLANGRNPIPILIPCHRVIDAQGRLHGYGGGLWRKRRLLELEGALQPEQAASIG